MRDRSSTRTTMTGTTLRAWRVMTTKSFFYVLESAAVRSIVKIGKDAGGNPATINAIFTATDEDTKADFRGTAYDLRYDAVTTDDDDEFNDAYAGTLADGKPALFTVDADGAVRVGTPLDTDADDSKPSISLELRTYDTSEVIPEPIDEDDDRPAELRRELKDVAADSYRDYRHECRASVRRPVEVEDTRDGL